MNLSSQIQVWRTPNFSFYNSTQMFMVSSYRANRKLNYRCIWVLLNWILRNARHGAEEVAVKLAEATLIASAALCHPWASKNLGPGWLCPYSLVATPLWDLTPACPGDLLESRWDSGDHRSFCPVSPALSQSGEERSAKNWRFFPLPVKSFFLISSQGIESVQENRFPSMSYSTNPKVLISA